MQLDRRPAASPIVYLDHEMARAAGGTYDDTEGLINLPLTVQGDPGGRLLQAGATATSTASACDRRATSTSARSRRRSAAAATRTPPAARSPAPRRVDAGIARLIERSRWRCRRGRRRRPSHASCTDPDVHGRRARHRQARRARRRTTSSRACGARSASARIGHTGTLDPLATGVLPLVLGRATRLARFLSGGDKDYEAVVRLGVATDTDDADGRAGRPTCDGRCAVARRRIDAALDALPRARSCSSRRRTRPRRSAATRGYELARAATTPVDAARRSPVDRAAQLDCSIGVRRRSACATLRARRARPASTSGRWRTTSGERLGMRRAPRRRCGGRGAATFTLGRRRRRSRRLERDREPRPAPR